MKSKPHVTRHLAGALLALTASCACGTPGPDGSQETPSSPTDAPEPDFGVGDPIRVRLEIDRLAGTPPLVTDQTINGQLVSLVDVYARAGVQLTIVQDQTGITAPSDLHLGQLHGLMVANRSVTAEPGVMHVYCLVATADGARPDTLGIMFDFDENDDNDLPREAFALFANAHAGLAGGAQQELLLTAAHELAHCFNLHHTDWEGQEFFAGATIESYSMTDSVTWSLSSRSIVHLREHPRSEVLGGEGGLPFTFITQDHHEHHQDFPNELYTIVPDAPSARTTDPQPLDQGRTALAREAAARVPSPPSAVPLALELSAPKTTYELGEPIALTVALRNTGPDPVDVMNLLDPAFGFMQIVFEDASTGVRHPWHPPVHTNARGRVEKQIGLPSGEALVAPANVFLGSTGWTFYRTGKWKARAHYSCTFGGRIVDLASTEVDLQLLDSATPTLRSAVQRDLVHDREAGLYLYLGGGEHLKKGRASLERLRRDFPSTAQAAAASFGLSAGKLQEKVGARDAAALADVHADLSRGYESAATPEQMLEVANELARQYDALGLDDEATKVRIEVLQKVLPRGGSLKEDQLKGLELEPILRVPVLEKVKQKARGLPGYTGVR